MSAEVTVQHPQGWTWTPRSFVSFRDVPHVLPRGPHPLDATQLSLEDMSRERGPRSLSRSLCLGAWPTVSEGDPLEGDPPPHSPQASCTCREEASPPLGFVGPARGPSWRNSATQGRRGGKQIRRRVCERFKRLDPAGPAGL